MLEARLPMGFGGAGVLRPLTPPVLGTLPRGDGSRGGALGVAVGPWLCLAPSSLELSPSASGCCEVSGSLPATPFTELFLPRFRHEAERESHLTMD